MSWNRYSQLFHWLFAIVTWLNSSVDHWHTHTHMQDKRRKWWLSRKASRNHSHSRAPVNLLARRGNRWMSPPATRARSMRCMWLRWKVLSGVESSKVTLEAFFQCLLSHAICWQDFPFLFSPSLVSLYLCVYVCKYVFMCMWVPFDTAQVLLSP